MLIHAVVHNHGVLRFILGALLLVAAERVVLAQDTVAARPSRYEVQGEQFIPLADPHLDLAVFYDAGNVAAAFDDLNLAP
jgi:hypothetical protein